MKKVFVLSILVYLIAQSSQLIAAPVYKWIDEDGQVHYGSKPKSKDAEKITIKKRYIDSGNSNAPLSAQERAENQKRFVNALDAERKAKEEEEKKKQKEEELKLKRCNAAQDQLKRYEQSGALYDLDEKGDRILLNKEQYEKAMSQARARVERWCN